MPYTIRVKPGSRKGPLVETDATGAADLVVFVRERAVVGVQSGSGFEEGRPLDQSW